MTKDQFITMLIAKLNEREDVARVVHIPMNNVFVTMKNGDTFPLVVGQKRRR